MDDPVRLDKVTVSEGHNTSWEVDRGVLIGSVQTMDTEEHFLYTNDQNICR